MRHCTTTTSTDNKSDKNRIIDEKRKNDNIIVKDKGSNDHDERYTLQDHRLARRRNLPALGGVGGPDVVARTHDEGLCK